MAHTNIVNHAAGWLEGGLTASYEKLVIRRRDVPQLLAEYLEPVVVDDDTLAIDAIAEVQPGRPLLRRDAHPGALRGRLLQADRVGLAQLRDVAGCRRALRGRTGERHLEAIARGVRAAGRFDPGIDEALREYMVKRKRAIEAGEVTLEQ